MMLARTVRLGSISIGLLATTLLGSVTSQALDLSSASLVYHEDFEGEGNFPTTPEINTLSIGATSSVGVDGNKQPFNPPYNSGGVAVFSIHSEVSIATQNVHVPSTFDDSFAMRATFDGFSVGVAGADGAGEAGVVGAFGISSTPIAVVSVGLGLNRSTGSTTGGVVLSYQTQPASPVMNFAVLSAPAISAILSGAAFTVDLAFDKTTMIATGSVDISGVGVFTPAPLDTSAIGGITSATPLFATNLYASEYEGMDLDVNAEEVSVYVLGEAASSVGLLDARVTAGAETFLENAGGTVRLEQPKIDAYGGAVFYVPEPMALWQIQSGVALLALLYARRRRV